MEQNKIEEAVRERIMRLDFLIAEKKKALQRAPEGRLRVSGKRGSTQYYQVHGKVRENQTYLRKKAEAELIRRLAQKEYDQEVLHAATDEREALTKLLFLEGRRAEDVYGTISEERKGIIRPIELPDAEYRREWEMFRYEGKKIEDDAAGFLTERGEHVRSKSEWIIADTLNRMRVPYRYECPLKLGGTTLYPDFTILRMRDRTELYWEHLGMMDDGMYAETAVDRILKYEQNALFPGERLILSHETRKRPLDARILKAIILKYCI